MIKNEGTICIVAKSCCEWLSAGEWVTLGNMSRQGSSFPYRNSKHLPMSSLKEMNLNLTRRRLEGNWWPHSRVGYMTSLLAGTVAHVARGSRGVSTSHCRRPSPELPRILRNSPGAALTTLYPNFESPWRMVLKPYLKHPLKIKLKNAYKFGLWS